MGDVTKVYHYCSPQSFKAIIETKSLWLTNTSTMNDTMEGIWYKNISRFQVQSATPSPWVLASSKKTS